MNKIQKYDGLIISEKRNKRELITTLSAVGGGAIMGWISDEITNYFFDKKELEQKADRLEKLLREQTSILAMSEDIMRKNQERFQGEMSLLINQTAEIFDHVDLLTRNTEMAERSQWATTYLIETGSDKPIFRLTDNRTVTEPYPNRFFRLRVVTELNKYRSVTEQFSTFQIRFYTKIITEIVVY